LCQQRYNNNSRLDNFSQYIKQGTAITVRGLIEGHEGAVVAFVSDIKQTLQIPSRIMVLEFPRTVSLQYLRSSIRIETSITAKVKITNEYWQATITNLSVTGCQLDIINGEKLVLAEHKDIEIVIEDFQGGGNIKLNAVVCNLKQQTGGLSFGVEFKEKSKSQVMQLLYQAITVTK